MGTGLTFAGEYAIPVEQWRVDSDTSDKTYTVSKYTDGTWACSCIGWTRHVPRRDCKHIGYVKTYGPPPWDPLVMAVGRKRGAFANK